MSAFFAVLTVGWHLIQPYADHDLATTALFTIGILFANLYRLLYGFALILILISYYNLSAKRWRDVGAALGAGRPLALARLHRRRPALARAAGRAAKCRILFRSSPTSRSLLSLYLERGRTWRLPLQQQLTRHGAPAKLASKQWGERPMDFKDLFLTNDGRLDRQPFWIGTIIILAILSSQNSLSTTIFGHGSFTGRRH